MRPIKLPVSAAGVTSRSDRGDRLRRYRARGAPIAQQALQFLALAPLEEPGIHQSERAIAQEQDAAGKERTLGPLQNPPDGFFPNGNFHLATFVAGDVAGAGAHGEFALALGPGKYSNGTIRTVTSRVAGNISKRVLMANVPSDALADGHYFAELVGKKRLAAGRPRQALEYTGIPVRILFVE